MRCATVACTFHFIRPNRAVFTPIGKQAVLVVRALITVRIKSGPHAWEFRTAEQVQTATTKRLDIVVHSIDIRHSRSRDDGTMTSAN